MSGYVIKVFYMTCIGVVVVMNATCLSIGPY